MATIAPEHADASPTPAPPTHTHDVRAAGRALKPTFLWVGALLAASAIAVMVALALGSNDSGGTSVSLTDFEIGMPTRLATGTHTLSISNDGSIPHELVIFKTSLRADRLPLESNGDVNEDSSALHSVADSGASIAPGTTRSIRTDALAPGHYVAVCNLPGHYRGGMRLDIDVR